MHRLGLTVLVLLSCVSTAAADERFGIFTVADFGHTLIRLEGEIERDSGVDLRKALRAYPKITTIELASDGGDLDGALDIAYAIRELKTVVPAEAECHAGCALIYFAGKTRESYGKVGLNQIWAAGTASEDEAKQALAGVLEALEDFGVAQEVIVRMLRTPAETMYVYEPGELVKLGLSDVPEMTPAPNAEAHALLLEASDTGDTKVLPTAGTIAWSKGTDDRDLPTIVAAVDIPDRGLSVLVTIAKNSDEALPAMAIAEVSFTLTEAFEGESIASLAGILAKNEELVQGKPLRGASARIVGSNFLFALGQSAEDTIFNSGLLTNSAYLDLAVIYETGRRAIVTLVQDEAAHAIVEEVVAAWDAGPRPLPAAPPGKGSKIGTKG